ncbi:hypothetical protein [Roseiconus lacunae]|uniref:Uncharacterized protein n=1 Tax=Roseiconus lacunae TaxID=2605694 RepID=A0ABT7PKU3_9BACT|nr:hypothetical protein [Roseiconus lacunae]MDM4017115.1 hypothetical protein [Roseiconus lacunae]
MRRFRIVDALYLTTSIAIALALHRWIQSMPIGPSGTLAKVFEIRLLILLTLCTITWTLGALVLKDRQPMPVSVRSPGRLAVLSITAASVFMMAMNWEMLFAPVSSPLVRMTYWTLSIAETPSVPACVAICGWLTIRASESETPPSDWINVAGILVAVCWIICAVANPLTNFIVMRFFGWI